MAKSGGEFRFNVSDVVAVPLRGTLLRLRLVDGTPSVKDLAVGRKIRVTSPGGESREVEIKAHTMTGGRQTQDRLERTREFDILVEGPAGSADPLAYDIGWTASGPVDARD